MTPKHEPAPRTPGDAELYMRQEARKYRDVAESEASRGANGKRIGYSLRIGAYFAEAADALGAWAAYQAPYNALPSEPADAVAAGYAEVLRPPPAAEPEGWLGTPCPRCGGLGEIDGDHDSYDGRRTCSGCGGTGEAYGDVSGFAPAEPAAEPEADPFA